MEIDFAYYFSHLAILFAFHSRPPIAMLHPEAGLLGDCSGGKRRSHQMINIVEIKQAPASTAAASHKD